MCSGTAIQHQADTLVVTAKVYVLIVTPIVNNGAVGGKEFGVECVTLKTAPDREDPNSALVVHPSALF